MDSIGTEAGQRLKQSREAAVKSRIQEEARLQESLIRHVRACLSERANGQHLNHYLLKSNPEAASPLEVANYWKSIPLTPVTNALSCVMRATPSQPVLAAISLRTRSAGPTLYVPVPYATAARGVTGLSDSIWINCDKSDPLQIAPHAAEEIARNLSHALANVSHSVRIDDEPVQGFLALAHKHRKPLYLPDVRQVHSHRSPEAESVSKREEPFLGMASVLYIPLDTDGSSEEPANSVLMLWSPVPRRWNGTGIIKKLDTFRAGEDNLDGVFEVYELADDTIQHLRSRMDWLEAIISRDEGELAHSTLESQSLILSLRVWAEAQRRLDWIDTFFHGTAALAEGPRLRNNSSAISLRQWAKTLLWDPIPNGIVQHLQKEWNKNLEGLPISLEQQFPGHSRYSISWKKERDEAFLACFPDDVLLDCDQSVAQIAGHEPFFDIRKHSESLKEIEFVLTRKFAKIRYAELPKESSLYGVLGSAESFQRYFAIRRGIAVPPMPDDKRGGGLGLWLHRVYAAETSIFRRLYVSPDGSGCHTDVAVPISRLGGKL